MKRKLSFMAAVLICGLMYTTCDFVKSVVNEPDVSLKSVDFTEISFEGLTLLSSVDVKNNNSIDIPLPKIDWDLHVIDIPFLDGVIQSDGSLKSNDSTEVQFPVSFTYENLIKAIIALTDENAKYKINMIVHIPVPQLGDLTWPFAHEGKIPIFHAPEITVASSPKSSVTLVPLGGKIDFALNVKNNSNVDVTVNDLSYVLKIGSTPLTGGVTDKPKIKSNETGKIDFSFPLTATDITNIGYAVLTGSNLTYELTGNYKFGIPEFPLLNEVGSSFTLP